MLIDIKNLTKENNLEVKLFSEIVVPVQGGTFPCKCDVSGVFSLCDDICTFEGKIIAGLSLNCDLCLRSFDKELCIDMTEGYIENGDLEKELWEFSDKTIDLKPAVLANIVSHIPMRLLCDETCKGLCPKCGQNLNEQSCNCDKDYINPVFEKLKTLLDDKEV